MTNGFHTDRIAVFTMDEIFLSVPESPAPWYAKIDVDGGELGVLKGATECLKSERWKAMMIEMNVNHDAALIESLQKAGWAMIAKYDQRDGQQIGGGVYYAEWRRV